ncbi:MAG: C69 family dipeptidase [Muribaculaceae bacterium]|nr:C69 family dipeptidase [Muribaculaceae bacterium]
MKLRFISAMTALCGAMSAMPCTSLIASKGVAADGSVMITYAADSHTLYGDMPSTAAADHRAGAMRKVYDWDSGKFLCEIPQPAHTYSTIGHINEHGLAMAESTWGGREELWDTDNGGIDYGSLIYITLERAKTAREAIKVMTDLVSEYGYASEGESFSIADSEEAWIMELIGKGPGRKGAVWVARRIPDGYISGHANNPRIHQFPLDDPETLYAPDVIDFAREKGYYDGPDSLFSFSKAYQVYDHGAVRACDARVWSFFNMFAPEAAAPYLPWAMYGEGEPMPLWVKPEKPIDVRAMQWAMRDHFEGTPMDMTQDIGAGPFDVPYRWRPMDFEVDSVKYFHERAIATQQTGFSFVAQCSNQVPESMKATLWFGCDDANTTVYSPVYSSMTKVPRCFEVGNGDLYTISRDAAFWAHNLVANQAYNRYSQMIPDIRRVQNEREDLAHKTHAEMQQLIKDKPFDEQRAMLTWASHNLADGATQAFFALNDFLTVKFLDGNIKKQNADGTFKRTESNLPEQPEYGGYNDLYFRSIVNETGDKFKKRF